VLDVRDLHVYYGEIHALKGISFRVGQGEIVTLLGNNGAGKTTTLRTLSGMLPPRTGDVRLDGASLAHVPAHQVVRLGITHVPEGRRIFNRLTVADNLEMGAYTRSDREIASDMERVFAVFPRLKERRTQVAGTLSGGEQQMLAIGRALMARPRLSVAGRGYVLETGEIVLEGPARALADDPEVRRAYLGES
jgi:branched-chain amino acid transport system ATP-binding protein